MKYPGHSREHNDREQRNVCEADTIHNLTWRARFVDGHRQREKVIGKK